MINLCKAIQSTSNLLVFKTKDMSNYRVNLIKQNIKMLKVAYKHDINDKFIKYRVFSSTTQYKKFSVSGIYIMSVAIV
jgi:hypothetical protein